eukprot:740566-Prymnesium_polylepis.1
MRGYDRLDETEWRMLLTGPVVMDASGLPANPAPAWVSEKMWGDICIISKDVPAFKEFMPKFAADPEKVAPALRLEPSRALRKSLVRRRCCIPTPLCHALTRMTLPLASLQFREFFDHSAPFEQFELLPDWVTSMTPFQQMLTLRVIRLDKLVAMISRYVANDIGQKYIEPPPFDLEGSYKDSSSTSPLVFILSPGVDPMLSLLKFAEGKGRK